MAKNKDDLKSLSQIFAGDVQFVIPDYQRGYSWEDKQLDDLWEDLENMTETNTHYTGMFTFCKDSDNDKIYYLVDGQQRMTTLIILINEILKGIKNAVDEWTTKEDCVKKYLYIRPLNYISTNLKYKFQYDSNDPSDAFFKIRILGQKCSKQPQDTLYTKNLLFAKEYFEKKLKEYNQDQLIALFKKVTERLKFNEYIIDDLNDVYVTFETMNNRGKNLSTLELLKNRLIYLTTLFSALAGDKVDKKAQIDNANNLRDYVNDTWKNIYEFLGKSSDKKLNDDSFLRDHWIMFFRYDRKTSMVFKKDLLTQIFVAKRVLNGELSMDDITEYVKSLNESIEYWFYINCPMKSDLLSVSEKIWLTRINRVGIGSFRPLLMAAYLKKDNNIEKLLEACERFRFLTFNVSGRRSNTDDSHFYGLAHDFYDVNNTTVTTIQELIEDVDSRTNKWLNIDGFIISAIDRYKNREGFYSWSGLRYFLYEYERVFQQGTTDKDEKVRWESFENNQKTKISIEHIYPQSPTDSYWTDRFKTQEDKNLTHSLGNLLLLSVSKNSEQQNYSFPKKKKTERDADGRITHHGYDIGSYREIEVANKDEWTPEEIKERGKLMLEFLNKHWKIGHLFTESEIEQILNVSSNIGNSNMDTNTIDEPDWARNMDSEV